MSDNPIDNAIRQTIHLEQQIRFEALWRMMFGAGLIIINLVLTYKLHQSERIRFDMAKPIIINGHEADVFPDRVLIYTNTFFIKSMQFDIHSK